MRSFVGTLEQAFKSKIICFKTHYTTNNCSFKKKKKHMSDKEHTMAVVNVDNVISQVR
jgi:hypothetical protein